MTHSLARSSSFRLTKRPFPDPALLLHPPIPPSLWGLNPRTLIGKQEWSRIRTSIISYNTRKHELLGKTLLCHACGSPLSECPYQKPLEGHEVYDYDASKLLAHFSGVAGLCFSCHSFLHRGRLELLRKSNRISAKKYNTIQAHGKRQLRRIPREQHTLFLREEARLQPYLDKTWSLVFMGVVYKGKAKSDKKPRYKYAGQATPRRKKRPGTKTQKRRPTRLRRLRKLRRKR